MPLSLSGAVISSLNTTLSWGEGKHWLNASLRAPERGCGGGGFRRPVEIWSKHDRLIRERREIGGWFCGQQPQRLFFCRLC